ncbi:hypothetical protein [Flavobacterium johnsoniae]|uniref:Uncharacterized protein n=1 Tax=Flavobacterium johnsoniae (strain ATCC 17061 / DSM 2064 / JCM 8514 / BCRC 14874 / CCUG 350202 / NBRC 14942 / NCIMB 11054 / UW101) TaxID=376686 RepID=A5FJ50_FLAJ1|nr:hypothetical protein [Flavobacterium johnsoniae]ABQ04775.1 hypothetical protein Fjoh_1743 [Flavobacterium johnsoniae UW101]OXG03022.1 hypothetical protein B0A63_01860 [Flavobacterium johnsoniae UW101]WQG83427.1 hypothetical protein SR927_09995 [Flavobacterium johnsoniae UW101]
MRINFILIMSALCITSFVHSQSAGITFNFGMGEQKANAVIFKKDKQKVSGIVNFPGLADKKVKIKVGEENEKYASSDIDSIQILDDNKKLSYTFVRTKTKVYKKKGTEFKVIDENWICKIITGKASLYLGGEEYGIKEVKVEDEKTKEKIKVKKMQVVSKEINHYLKRSNEDYPVLVSVSSNALSAGYNAFFKEYGVYYFSDNPEIAKKIEDKEYKYDDIEKVVDLYNVKREKKAESKSALKATKIKITPPDSKAKTTKKK